MADIFISYSSKDRVLAAHLAAGLEARGFSVFWDFNLIGGRRFRAQIQRELAAARAAIVIWTERSITSGFVLVEAHEAAAGNKLVAVCEEGFGMEAVPAALRQAHTFPLSDPGGIAGAVAALSSVPAPEPPPAAKRAEGPLGGISLENCLHYLKQFHSGIYVDDIDDAIWEELAKSGEIGRYEEYLSVFPDGRHSKIARSKIERSGDGKGYRALCECAYPVLYSIASGLASSLLLTLPASSAGGVVFSVLSGIFLASALSMSIARRIPLDARRYAPVFMACVAGSIVAVKFAATHLEAHYYANDPTRVHGAWLAVIEAGFYAGAIASAFIYIGLAATFKLFIEIGVGVSMIAGGSVLGMLLYLPYLDNNFEGIYGWAGLFIPWHSFIVLFVMYKVGDGVGAN
jgi:TIR domain